MFKILTVTLSFIFFNAQAASDSVSGCTAVALNTPQEEILISDMVFDEKMEMAFCFDPHANQGDLALMEEFKLLESSGLFDKNNCLIEKNKNESNEGTINKFIQKNLDKKLQVYASVNPKNQRVNLIYSNSENKNFIDSALNSKDKWQIAGFSTASIALGALVSEQLYKGEADKRKHWIMGATISGITTGATYFVLETAGVGDKLHFSKEVKSQSLKGT